MMPQVKITQSLPSLMTLPLPTVKGRASYTGEGRRAVRMYTGPLISAAARTHCSHSVASLGTNTVMFGSTRIRAISSIA